MTLYKIISSEYCSLIVWIFLQLKINKQRSNSSSHYSLIDKIKHHRTRHTHLEQMPFHSSEAEYICWFILLVTFDILCPLHVSIAHIKCTCTLNILLLKISNFGSLKQQDYDPNDLFRLLDMHAIECLKAGMMEGVMSTQCLAYKNPQTSTFEHSPRLNLQQPSKTFACCMDFSKSCFTSISL